MKKLACLLMVLIVLGVVTHWQARWLNQRPVAVKLGYTPAAEVQRLLAGEHCLLLSELAVVRVLFYFGSLVEKWQNQVMLPPEYFNMYKTIENAVKLDPYNMDAYYFAQGAFTWEVGRAREVNALLDYGMQYRTDDWYLPYFAGFNSAFFLHEYEQAAQYMERAAQLSGKPLLAKLAARYFYEAGRTELGISYLQGMIAEERDPQQKNAYQLRLEALLATRAIEQAVEDWRGQHGNSPASLEQLVTAGFLEDIPQDPYGGQFFLDDNGRVRTTSKFAFARAAKDGADDGDTGKALPQ